MQSVAAVAFHLDTVASGSGDDAGEITGWIFGREGAHCGAVRLRTGAHAMLAVHGLPRPDVQACYPEEPGAPLSGFRVSVDGGGRGPMALEWMDGAGRWREFWREPTPRRRRSPPKPELSASLLSFVIAETAAANRNRSWRETWRHAVRLVDDCSQRLTPLAADGDWLACLDEPSGEVLSGQYVALSGWIFGRNRPVGRAFAHAEPGGLVHVIHPMPRPDVAAAYAALSAPAACGFAGMIKLPPAGTSWFVLRLYVETTDGATHLVLVRRFFLGIATDQVARDWRALATVGALALGGRCRLASGSDWWRELRTSMRKREPRFDAIELLETVVAEAPDPELGVEPLADDPLISILVPVFNPSPRHLREMIGSVRAQHYPRWELCLADDASTASHVRPLLEQFAREDPRIRPVFRPENGQIARATNSALALAGGEFVAFLDQDDLLAPEVLLRVVECVRAHVGVQFLYTDRDKVDDHRHHYDVERRGAWNPAMAITHNYLHHLTVIRRDLVERVGGCRAEYFGSQDLDLYLRCHEMIEPGQIRHVPVIGYHWRAHPGSTASRGDQKSYMVDSARRGIEDALRRRGLRAAPFLPDFAPFYGLNLHQLRWDAALLRENPVSVVLAVTSPAGDWTAAVAALARTVPPGAVQLIIVAAGRIARVQDWPAGWRPEYVALPAGTPLGGLFNHGASLARHALLLLQDARAMASEPGWLEDLVGWLSVSGVDAVGPKLIAADGLVASAGWTINSSTGLPQPLFAGRAAGELGHQFLPHVARDSLLLDPACLLTRTARFRELGGYAADFPAACFAADYCLRLHDRGTRVVFTPQATLRWVRGAGNESDALAHEATLFRQRHAGRVDPWISPARILPEGEGKPPVGASWQEWMPAGTVEFAGGWFFLEHPRPGTVLADGRLVARGWCLPCPGHPVDEVRVRVGGRIHWLTYGHPRADLAVAAGRAGEFLPVGFDLEIDLPAGATRLKFEVRGEGTSWQQVESVEITVTSGTRVSRDLPVSWEVQLAEGAELLAGPSRAGTLAARARTLAVVTPWQERARSPALPFHGYWDEPTGLLRPVYGGVEIRGWLFHETRAVRRVVAGFSPEERLSLAHQCESAVIARRFASFPTAARCAVSGFVPVRPSQSLCRVLRIWAELDDGTWHLVYVRRSWMLGPAAGADNPGAPGSVPVMRSVLALRWALFRAGLPGPRLPALWGAMKLLRKKHPKSEPLVAALPPLAKAAPTPREPHVLLVTHNLNQEGAPYFLLELARFMKRETGARISVVSSAEGPLRRDFEGAGIAVRVLDRKPLWQARTSREVNLALAGLADGLQAGEANVVVANTIESFWAVLAARQAGRPALFYIHEPGVLGVHYLGDLSPAGRALAAHALADAAARVSFPSGAAQEYYRRFARADSQRIQPGWTDLDRLVPADRSGRRAAMRRQLGLADEDFLVINVGTVCPRKGQLHFVAAAERLRRTQPDLAARCRFVMVGAHDNIHGEVLRASIAGLAPGHGISLVPATPEIGDYFAAADVFVLTSFEEGFPRVLLEAMGFALPIISTAVHGIPEIVRDSQEALLVPPGDAGMLADALQRLLEDRELARRLGEQAQFRVEANFTAERVLPQHLRTIRELAPELGGTASKIPPSDLPDSIPAAS